jgi:seryl-tRNA synthetase
MDLEEKEKLMKQLEQLFNLNKKRHQEIEKLKELNKQVRFISKGLRTSLKEKESKNNALIKKNKYLNAVIKKIQEHEKIDGTDNVNFALNLLDINDF